MSTESTRRDRIPKEQIRTHLLFMSLVIGQMSVRHGGKNQSIDWMYSKYQRSLRI